MRSEVAGIFDLRGLIHKARSLESGMAVDRFALWSGQDLTRVRSMMNGVDKDVPIISVMAGDFEF